MALGCKLDMEVWHEFSSNWEELSFQAGTTLSKRRDEEVAGIIMDAELQMIPEGTVKEQLIKTRIGQYFFRMAVLNSYDSKCCIDCLCLSCLLQVTLNPGKIQIVKQKELIL